LNDTAVPHTVTFGEAPELVLPEPQPGGPPNLVINPSVLFPVAPGSVYSGTGYVNSGFLSAGPEGIAGTSFQLTFSNPGTYLYVCVLHANQGMAGVVEVLGSATGGTVRPPATGDAGLKDETPKWIPAGSATAVAAVLAIGLSLALARLTYRIR
jgi:plastocyanin